MKRIFVLLLASVPLLVTSAAMGANAIVSIQNSHSGQCLDDNAGSKINGNGYIQYACYSGTNQHFNLQINSDGSYTFINRTSNLCLDINGASTANGARLIQYTCHGGANQKFKAVSLGSGKVKLVVELSGKCIDISGSSTASAAIAQQYDCNGSLGESFVINTITPATGSTPAPTPVPTPVPSPTPLPAPKIASFLSFANGGFVLSAGQKQSLGSGLDLLFTADADLEVVDASGNILWQTKTHATCGSCSATFQGDGNLVIYGPSGALWSSGTYNKYGTLTLAPQASYLTIRDWDYRVVWSSGGSPSAGETQSSLNPTQASSVQSFLKSLAINTHMDQYEGNVTTVLNKLNYLGVHTIRDHYTDNGSLFANYKMLSQNGIHFDMLDYSSDFSLLISHAETLAGLGQGILTSVEGPNEINNFSFSCNGSVWSGGWPNNNGPAAQCFMTNFYQDIKKDPKLDGVAVYDLTGGNSAKNAASYGLLALTGQADAGNLHSYPSGGGQPRGQFLNGLGATYTMVLPAQAAITETGYSTAKQSGPVSLAAQAILDLNIYLDAFQEGFQQTFIYELTDNSGEGYGVFDSSGNAKPAAVAIHNLTAILADSGDAISHPASFSYSVTGLGAAGATLLLEKSNGVFELALWNEPTVWSGTADVTVASAVAQIAFGRTFTKVNVYNPFIGTLPIQQSTSASSINVSYAAQALVIELIP